MFCSDERDKQNPVKIVLYGRITMSTKKKVEKKKPSYIKYHESIAAELIAAKDKIRNLVDHWPTDGGWKEVVLRNILRKHLPESCIVGQGFIVGKDTVSSQIDVLVVSKNQPTLFKDGDMLIVTPSAVRAIIEVKTNLSNIDYSDALIKLAENVNLCAQYENDSVWSGIFDYDSSCAKKFCQKLLKALSLAKKMKGIPINSIACGQNLFIRYWASGEREDTNENLWRAYKLFNLAPAYFIGNLIEHITSIDNSSSSFAWFPIEGTKETCKTYEIYEGESKPHRCDR
jgi:hypothetical protein